MHENRIIFKIPGLLLIVFFQFYAHLFAQQSLPVPVNIQSLYNKGTKSQDGKPGDKYWQNTASYDIDINFNPSTLLIAGTEKVVYINKSPDTLYNIIFKLYPNLYKKGAERAAKIESEDIGEGMTVDKVNITNSPVLTYSLDGTNMNVTIPPLLPKDSIIFNIGFHYTLNKGSHIRTGQVEPDAGFIAYFFPRIAVYDDIDGWNKNKYLGTQEFYNDFCSFNVSVTVPKNFVVWATGDLTNCNEVLDPKILRAYPNGGEK